VNPEIHWRPQSSECGDAHGGHDRASLDMDMDTMIM